MMTNCKITEFALRSDGTRCRQFEINGVYVQVQAANIDHEQEAIELAEELLARGGAVSSSRIGLEQRCVIAERKAYEAIARAARLAALVPPPSPRRMLGPGCVRFCGTELWLLNRRESGWSSWGVRCDGWDDLFRRFEVTITEHGTDEHGAYWIAVPESR